MKELKSKLYAEPYRAQRGYCQKRMDGNGFSSFNNRKVCKSNGGTANNVGFLFTAWFPIVKATKANWCFILPVDFGLGGAVFLNGYKVKSYAGNIWENGNSKRLDFCTRLSKRTHKLELIGAENCCDGATTWRFNINGGNWRAFTEANFEKIAKDWSK